MSWAGFDEGTWETRKTWDVEWNVEFQPPHLSREQVIAAFDDLDSRAPATVKKKQKRKQSI